ncbi:MAG: hypothetical protein U1G07_05885 [Verrucomicrobiota bacterium]
MQWLLESAQRVLTAKKAPQRRDNVLKASVVIGFGALLKKGIDLIRLESSNSGTVLIKLQELQEEAQTDLMPLNRGLGHPAYFTQVRRVRLQFWV